MIGLTPFEKQQIKSDINTLTKQQSVLISYYTNNYSIGYSENQLSNDWSEFDSYECSIEKVNKFNINRYQIGNIKEGDLVVLLPSDTSLSESSQYIIKYQGLEYTSKTGLQPMEIIDDEPTYYILVGQL
jgi:hypothetical protein